MMISFELFQLIVNASSEAYFVSQLSAYNQEIVDGGTKNRIWSFFSIYALANIACSPLMFLLPAIDFGLILLGSAFILGGLFYVASIAQENQMALNENEPEKIKKLPMGLHENQYIMQAALFLSLHLSKALLVFYGLSLVACIFLGAPLYAYISLGMYTFDQLYQYGYVPEYLKTPYLCLCTLLTLLGGITSTLDMALVCIFILFTTIDYIRCSFWGEDSPTAQFPMTDSSKKTDMPSFDAHDLEENNKFAARIKKHAIHRKDAGIHVTFDHVYASYDIVNTLLEGAPAVDYKKYVNLFNAIDFSDKKVRNNILNEMVIHDKFNRTTLGEHCEALSLPLGTQRVDVQIAYLKQEMVYFSDRLRQSSYRDFTHEQAALMHRYARLLLPKIEASPVEQQILYLLHIAITTGSHCNRAYLESLTYLASKESLLLTSSLSLHDEAMLRAQEAREEAFRAYYHKVAPKLRDDYLYFKIMWADTGDYHTYEDFVSIFGANFYLLNASFTTKFGGVGDIIFDDMLASMPRGAKLLFCEHYTVDYLVEQAVTPGKKLYPILERWCKARQVSLVDEDFMPKFKTDSPELRVLAELMLLDLNIVACHTPYAMPEPLPAATNHKEPVDDKTKQWSFAWFSLFQPEGTPKFNTKCTPDRDDEYVQHSENTPC